MINKKPIVQELVEAFARFHKLNWKHSPVQGLKSSEIWVLYSIKKNVCSASPGIKVSDLGGFLKVATPTVTQLINGLEKKSLVERTMDSADRRAVRVKLTPEGDRIILQASEAFYESFNGLVEHLGEQKSLELAELLTNVYEYYNKCRRDRSDNNA